MPDYIISRLRRFHTRYFPRLRKQFKDLVDQGQHPTVLFIGCSDSRVVPYLLMDSGPGELFVVRNVGGFLPPFDASHGYHGTAAAIEFAVLNLGVSEIIVCGHSHCGAIRALYTEPHAEATHMKKWLDLARDAVLPVTLSEEVLRRTEQRAVALQIERLMEYPMVRRRVEAGDLYLRGWHYLIDTGLLASASAIAMAVAIRQYPFSADWLTAKLLALLCYIGLGMIALKFGRRRGVRLGAWLAAQAVFFYIIAVAITRDPLPWLVGT